MKQMAQERTLIGECQVSEKISEEKMKTIEELVLEYMRKRKLVLNIEFSFQAIAPLSLKLVGVMGSDGQELDEAFVKEEEGFLEDSITGVKIYFYMFKKCFQDVLSEKETPFERLELPARQLDCLWENLYFDDNLKRKLFNIIGALFYLAERRANRLLFGLNRIFLLHGIAGTGKTTLCKALAQKIAVRNTGNSFALIEINCQLLFSKWFSESGKQIATLFGEIRKMATDRKRFLFLLVDEVETITLARKTALEGNEPSDSVRAVNALLTELDKVAENENIIIFGTTNLLSAIDPAFLNRVDIIFNLRPLTQKAIYTLLAAGLKEMIRCGLIYTLIGLEKLCPYWSGDLSKGPRNEPTIFLWQIAEQCNLRGFSGRTLRKLPFVAYSKIFKGPNILLEMAELLVQLDKEVKNTE